MSLVLFLGAGFSVPFGLPTMDGFLDFADASTRLEGDDKSLLSQLILEARRANSFLESSPTNLEDILSFSVMGERLSLGKPEENRGERLRRIVQRVFTSAKSAASFWAQYERVPKLLGSRQHGPRPDVTFITTNYDLNIEAACQHAGWYSNPGFELHRSELDRVSISGSLYHDQGIPLFKLHGSVNWYLDSSAASGVVVEDRIVNMAGGGRLPYCCAGDYESPSTPLIVPPSFLKPEMSSVLRTIWSGAARALSEASIIAFVGYSFPPSDTEMMYFLARALSENASLRRIWIIDPNADSLVARLRSPQSKTGSHFRDLIRPVAAKWQELENSVLALA